MRIILPILCNILVNFVSGLLLAKFLGPAEYGRFALTLAVAAAVQILCFDWLRLAAIRFYSEQTRSSHFPIRATLDASFAALAGTLGLGSIALLLSGIDTGLSKDLVSLAVAASIVNGLFDYHMALARARFQDGAFARMLIAKNFLSVGFTVGGALVFGSAAMTVAGLCISMAGSLLLSRRSMTDTEARSSRADRRLIRSLLRYALPIVAANVLYQIIPLTNRAMAAAQHGFAVSGQFSLAYDIGFRIASAIGTALDLLLFQMAVRLDEEHGPERSRQAIGHNMGIVYAILAPACVGCWLVLPSFEFLLVPQAFRGPFAHYFTLLLPGLFCYAMIHWAVNPIFQIAKRTGALIAVALIASLANGLLLLILPPSSDASTYAVAQSGALGIGLAALLLFAAQLQPVWPRTRDLALTTLATLAMAATVAPLRSMTPGVAALVLQIGAGILVYAALAMLFDLSGLRSMVSRRIGRWPGLALLKKSS